jgi:hypothetical protein
MVAIEGALVTGAPIGAAAEVNLGWQQKTAKIASGGIYVGE